MLLYNAFLLLSFLIHGCVSYSPLTSCPDSDLIRPCICKKVWNSATTVCDGLTSIDVILQVFSNVPGWKIDQLQIVNSSLLFIPSSILNNTKIGSLLIQDSTFVSLFDQPPSLSTTYINIVNCVFQRGIQWSLFSLMPLKTLRIQNTRIRSLGKDFRDGVPKTLNALTLIKTNVSKIRNDSLTKLNNLEFLTIRYAFLRNIDHLIFPKIIQSVEISYTFIESLTDGIFNILPRRNRMFFMNYNLITTLKKEVFLDVNSFTFVHLRGYEDAGNPINCNCNIKWIVTSGIDKKKIYAVCATPKSLKGKLIEDLTTSDFAYCQ